MVVSTASGGQHPAFPMGMPTAEVPLVNTSVSAPFSCLSLLPQMRSALCATVCHLIYGSHKLQSRKK